MKHFFLLLSLAIGSIAAMENKGRLVATVEVPSLSNKLARYFYCIYEREDGKHYKELFEEKMKGEFPALPPIVVATYNIAERPSKF